MPRHTSKKNNSSNRKQYKKNYNHVKKAPNNGGIKKSSMDDEAARKSKKFKHMMRNKESEDTLKAQKQIELQYKSKLAIKEESSESEEEIINPFDELLSTFKNNETRNKKSEAIESSSESEEGSMDDDDDDSDNSESDLLENEDMIENESEEDDYLDLDSNSDLSEIEKVNNKKDLTDREEIDEEDYQDEEIDEEELQDEEFEDDDNDQNSIDDDTVEEDSDYENIKENDKNQQNADETITDPFLIHLSHDINPSILEFLTIKSNKCKTEILNWPELGRLQVEIPKSHDVESLQPKKKSLISLDDDDIFSSTGTIPERLDDKNLNLKLVHVKNFIEKNVPTANKANLIKYPESKILNPFQTEIFSVLNNYQDFYFAQRTLSNGEEIRLVYSLHLINHVLKSRSKIMYNNGILGKLKEEKVSHNVPDECRDQGLTRPKVLILVPFRESALRVVNNIVDLLVPGRGEKAINYSRFVEEFSGETISFSKRNPKPEDYEQTFAGNSDDSFRIGLNLTKKCIKLYTDFYSSDILIASPLGLRLIIGAPGEAERDYDFLASIEMLILDQTELFHAQNWNHLLHLLDHLHLQPQSAKNTDFSRVRSWHLNGWSRFYRQTLLFSSHDLPDFRSIFNQNCSNYRGKVRIANPIIGGTVRNVFVQIPQVFQRIDVSSWETSFDTRFEHFINKVLPECKGVSMAHCLIYVPSYLDYVRIRNYLKKETISYVQICEYTKDEKMARARDMFFHSSAHFLLYSERAHFFRRTRIKGIRHIVMYQPPNWPNFYAELINFMQEANQNKRDGGESNMSVTVLYTKYDMMQVASIVGSEKAVKMAASDKSTHLFMTGK